MIVWHVPAVFELALRSHFLHEFEQSVFSLRELFSGARYPPGIKRCDRFPCPFPLLSVLRHSAMRRPFRHFWFLWTRSLPALLVLCRALSPVSSGQPGVAGALMWVTVTFAYLIPALAVTAKLLSGGRGQAAEAGVLPTFQIAIPAPPSIGARLRATIPDLQPADRRNQLFIASLLRVRFRVVQRICPRFLSCGC